MNTERGGMTQLARVLAVMGSAHDGEVLKAARLAERTRRTMDKSWVDLLAGNSSDAEKRAIVAEGRLSFAEQRAAVSEARCKAAEARVAQAEAHSKHLGKLLSESETELQAARAQKSTMGFWIVTALRNWMTHDDIRRATGWECVPDELGAVARRFRCTLQTNNGLFGDPMSYRIIADDRDA
jgi:hypothetical protein